MTPKPPASDRKPSRPVVVLLVVLCALDAGVQLFAWLARSPFNGIGVLGFALLPLIGLYYMVLLAAIVAGIPLAIACFATRRQLLIAIGAALVTLSAINAHGVYAWYTGLQAERRERSRTEEAQALRLARCNQAIDRVVAAARADFAVPRKVVALGPHTSVELDNGMRIALPFQLPAEAFRAFYYERLIGTPVRVVLREDVPGWREMWCATRAPYEPNPNDPAAARDPATAPDPGAAGDAGGPGDTRQRRRPDARAAARAVVDELPGDLYVAETLIEPTADLARDFPLPQPAHEDVVGSATIARFADVRSGDRTYATSRVAPPGYAADGRAFRVRTAPFDGSRAIYLCNAPLERPASAEHFVSLDSACEGREMAGLLGHIGTSRDARTPRALLRCLHTVQSPLRTGPRHLITTDVRECNNGVSIEAVLGFVA